MNTDKSTIFSGGYTASQRLTWTLVVSLLLHIGLFSQLNWKAFHTNESNPLIVRLIQLPPTEKKSHLIKAMSPHHVGKGNKVQQRSKKHEPHSSLDMESLLAQASTYAKQEYRISAQTPFPHSDYYGSYTGSDEGTFFFHLDRSGHASGTGQSERFGVNFLITGNTTREGIIQMTGDGIAGNANFSGKLQLKTGQVSGTWVLANFGNGRFRGKRE